MSFSPQRGGRSHLSPILWRSRKIGCFMSYHVGDGGVPLPKVAGPCSTVGFKNASSLHGLNLSDGDAEFAGSENYGPKIFNKTGKCMTWKMTGQEPDVGLCPESGVYSAIGFGADFEEASASAFHEVFGEVNISECWFTDIVRCLLGLPSRLVTDSGVARRSRRGGVCRSRVDGDHLRMEVRTVRTRV